jgi:hypothetical protein
MFRRVLGIQQPPIHCLRISLYGSKAVETWNWSFTSIRSSVNAWSYISTPQWLFMILSLINQKENLIFNSVLTLSFHLCLSVLNYLFYIDIFRFKVTHFLFHPYVLHDLSVWLVLISFFFFSVFLGSEESAPMSAGFRKSFERALCLKHTLYEVFKYFSPLYFSYKDGGLYKHIYDCATYNIFIIPGKFS